ncbi:MAG: hypothetical protein ISS36_04120 [Candidatus Aenigmarchaeota archaeon]|nr:hypothetical protein [Candidatus Aenigmarchaeota archaeon]
MTNDTYVEGAEMDLFNHSFVRGVFKNSYVEVPNLRVDKDRYPDGGYGSGLSAGSYKGISDVNGGRIWLEEGLEDYEKVKVLAHENGHQDVAYTWNDTEDFVVRATDGVMDELDRFLFENDVSYAELLGAIESKYKVGDDGGDVFTGMEYGYGGRGDRTITKPETIDGVLVPTIWKAPITLMKYASILPAIALGNFLSMGRKEAYKMGEGIGNSFDSASDALTNLYREWSNAKKKAREQQNQGQNQGQNQPNNP